MTSSDLPPSRSANTMTTTTTDTTIDPDMKPVKPIVPKSAIGCGFAGIILMAIALINDRWLHCQETTVLFDDRHTTSVAFQVGLWKVCPVNREKNVTGYYWFAKSNAKCINVRYDDWVLNEFEKLEVWPSLQFMVQFIPKMRITAPFGCFGMIMLVAATICTIFGYVRLDNMMLLACALFVSSGILIGCGLLVFASVLADSFYEGTSTDNEVNITYYYGTAFYFATAALGMVKLAVIFSVTSHMRKYGSIEDMVRAMVPGADRLLRQRFSNERSVRVAAVPELLPPPAPYRDEPAKPDLCELELHGSLDAIVEAPAPIITAQPTSRFKTISGREARYAAPPKPPAQFYTLPRRPAEQPLPPTTFCTKSAV